MSNLIRNLLLAGAVAIGAVSFGQAAQASPFDALEIGGFSVELGDLDLDDVGYADFDDDDDEDEYAFEDEDEDEEDDE